MMESTELYNLIALSGLLLCKVILLVLIFFYCCRRKKAVTDEEEGVEVTAAAASARSSAATASSTVFTVAAGNLKGDSSGGKKVDLPPTYSTIMLQIDPPEYLDSILNEDLNPVFNHSWALDLHKGDVKPEVVEVISRSSRENIRPISRQQENEERPNSAPAMGAFWIGI